MAQAWFDNLMMLCILASMVHMCFDTPRIDNHPAAKRTLMWTDVALTSIFGLEIVVKTTADSVSAYFRELSNQVDFIIVVVSIVLFTLENSSLSVIKGLRVLRALKPLRTLGRSQGMRVILRSVVYSLAAMGDVSIVVLLFMFIFSIMGV